MSDIYVMRAGYDRHTHYDIQHFTNLDNLAVAVLEARENGAMSLQVFRCVEVDFNAYWQVAKIDIGAYKKDPKA
jgi:hypothetical protein